MRNFFKNIGDFIGSLTPGYWARFALVFIILFSLKLAFFKIGTGAYGFSFNRTHQELSAAAQQFISQNPHRLIVPANIALESFNRFRDAVLTEPKSSTTANVSNVWAPGQIDQCITGPWPR